jgi:hypothetical protein
MVCEELRLASRDLPLRAYLFLKLLFDSNPLSEHDVEGAVQDVQSCLCISGFGTVARMKRDPVLQPVPSPAPPFRYSGIAAAAPIRAAIML